MVRLEERATSGRVPDRSAAVLRIGIFGGTFDPPHVGHLLLAERAIVQLGLDRVLFVPAGTPPHKRVRRLSPAAHRLAMTRRAIAGNERFQVSTLELRRRGASYTVDTLRALGKRIPKARLFLLIGEDSLREFETWREPDAIRSLATLVVARRSRSKDEARAERAHPRVTRGNRLSAVVWLAGEPLDLSSSRIREEARHGCSIRYLVPDRVAEYVSRHRLYGGRR